MALDRVRIMSAIVRDGERGELILSSVKQETTFLQRSTETALTYTSTEFTLAFLLKPWKKNSAPQPLMRQEPSIQPLDLKPLNPSPLNPKPFFGGGDPEDESQP